MSGARAEDGEGSGDDVIELVRGLRLKLSECRTAPLRSGGPGGQNVNKVSNGVELRWNVGESAAVGPGQKERVRQRLASRINAADELVLGHKSSEAGLQRVGYLSNGAARPRVHGPRHAASMRGGRLRPMKRAMRPTAS